MERKKARPQTFIQTSGNVAFPLPRILLDLGQIGDRSESPLRSVSFPLIPQQYCKPTGLASSPESLIAFICHRIPVVSDSICQQTPRAFRYRCSRAAATDPAGRLRPLDCLLSCRFFFPLNKKKKTRQIHSVKNTTILRGCRSGSSGRRNNATAP